MAIQRGIDTKSYKHGLTASFLVLALTGCMSGSGGGNNDTDPSAVPVINDADRVLWLTLDEANEAATADASSYSHTISSIEGTTTISGVANNARSFTGDPSDVNNSFIKVADTNTLDLTTALSISAWVKPTLANQTSFILAKNQRLNDGMAYALGLHQGAIEVRLEGNAYQTSYILSPNQWTHVAARWDGSVLRIFVNGIELNERFNSADEAIQPNAEPLIVGARNRPPKAGQSNETKGFTGSIDEISVYRIALLPSQICVEAGRTWTSGTCSGGAFGGATPTATSAVYALNAEDELAQHLVATDTDSANLIYTVGDIGTKGHLTITDPTTGAFSYLPDPMAEGTDQFTFYATDGVNRSEAGTVTINITRTNVDTDGDGMFDHIERIYGLNPNDATDATTDLDGDGDNNLAEVIAGTDPTLSNITDSTRAVAFGFSEGTGLSAYDHSGNGNDAALDRPQRIIGPMGGALDFHGADAITVVDSPSLDLTTALTVSAWINPEVEDQLGYILAKNFGWATDMAYAVSVHDGKLRIVINNVLVTSNATVPTKEWSHIAITWTDATVLFYVNGTLVDTKNYDTANGITLAANTERLIIGGRNRLGTGHSELFTGAIDQVQIWNRVLSNGDVCANYGGAFDGTTCTK